MALNECKKCHQPAPKWAMNCPHCSAKQQPVRAKDIVIGLLVIAGAITLYSLGATESSTATSTEITENAVATTATQPTDSQCMKDINCWFEHTMPAASYPCQEAIEKQAKYEVKWDDSFMSLAFTQAAWSNQEEGVIVLMGDKVKFQNGYGAFQNMRYTCTWSPATETVLDVAVEPGRI